jgi:hypothetical protein
MSILVGSNLIRIPLSALIAVHEPWKPTVKAKDGNKLND